MNGGFRVRPDGQFVANKLDSGTAQKGGQEAGTAPQTNQSGNASPLPSISLPKGGGAIRGIGEKFAANPVTGTGSLSVPIFTSPSRSGFGPQLSLSYDSGSGNGPFGLGWSLSLPSITRKTDKGLPKYQDADESDEFILSGAEDLVPVFKKDQNGNWTSDIKGNLIFDEELLDCYVVRRYRPRIEGLFARIERWTRQTDGDIHWRSISKDNILTIYGRDAKSRIYDPADNSRIFSWLICESYDDKGNAILYEYTAENNNGIDLGQANERNRTRTANRYLKRIKYGNCKTLMFDTTVPSFRKSHIAQPDFTSAAWMFEVVFDYEEGHYEELPLDNTLSEAEQHRFAQASASAGDVWFVRPDPFSLYRSGFEIRTYRRCQRVLMFHNFPELGSEPYLVRSTEFDYNDLNYSQPVPIETELEHKGSTRFASFIRKITQSGFVRDETRLSSLLNGVTYLTYLKKSLPPLEFEYSLAAIQEEIQEIDTESLENLPYGLDGTRYQWVDLDGEGLSGILTEQAGAWFYKPNLGDGEFGPMETVATKPSLASLSGGNTQLLDLAGDGQLDVAEFGGTVPGFYERTVDEKWENFIPFTSLPNISWKDQNLKFVDLTGDGHADVMITEDEVFTWYPSLAEEGFGLSKNVRQALDEEKGPRLVFDDGTQSISLADFSGDGLTDLVRIRNGEVCYWPNLGYGRFGAKVTMDNAPWFDHPDMFDQKRIRLADIDGSGVTDIIYLGHNGVQIYFNHSGNSWSGARTLTNFPHIDNFSSIQVADLFGNGTACLVWSSPLPCDSGRPTLYIDLMGGKKPHLLEISKNNMGAQTVVQYAASTKFYLKDKKEEKPWITRIPFPVHVVERVETKDLISKNRFVTHYAYHHGYFDGIEREFRGFGMVEQRDTEEIGDAGSEVTERDDTNWDETSFVPPVLTRTWFHTGAYLRGEEISRQLAYEYFGAPDRDSPEFETFLNTLLDDTILPSVALTADETREACRALKGSILRQEVYAEDGCPKAVIPYSVSERNYTIELLQPRESNKHAVFFTHANETINYHYERNIQDPRIQHEMVIEVDDFGNVERSVAIGYPRRLVPDRLPEQAETHITLTVNRFINSPELLIKFPHLYSLEDLNNWYRVGLPVETQTYEGIKFPDPVVSTTSVVLFKLDDIRALTEGLFGLDEEEPDPSKTLLYKKWNWRTDPNTPNETRLRVIERVRTVYRRNDLNGFYPPGHVDSLALPGETYKLAFTPGLLEAVYNQDGTGPAPDLSNVLVSKDPDGGGYVDLDGNGNWWIPSGQIFYSPDSADDPVQELDFAGDHFFLPHRFCDPFGNNTVIMYDSNETDPQRNHNLLMTSTRDELDNTVVAQNNYRVLQPVHITDPNGAVSEALFDALGLVVATAVHKGDIGDQLPDVQEADLTQQQTDDFFADPRGLAVERLGTATTRIIYDVDCYYLTDNPDRPPYAATIARETHVSDLPPMVAIENPSNITNAIVEVTETEAVKFKVGDGVTYYDVDNDVLHDERKKIISVGYVVSSGVEKTQITLSGEWISPPVADDLLTIVVPVQISFSYSDGFGREIQKKIPAEPGPIKEGETVNPRWVGSGWTIFNNKGKPVRKYEPFFDNTHIFKYGEEFGVSSILFYDPVERVICTLHPNHTYEKVVFDPWHQKTYDVNDTIAGDPRTDTDISGYVRGHFEQVALQPGDWKTWLQQRELDPLNPPQETPCQEPPGLEPEKKAAVRTLVHADTPTTAFFDSLGRTFITVAHNKFERRSNCTTTLIDEKHRTRVVFDIEGNQREVRDERKNELGKTEERIVMQYDYDMLSNRIHQSSMEAGERWMLNNAAGNPIRAWDSRGFKCRMTYDALQRPVELCAADEGGTEFLAEKTEYGESKPDPDITNHRLKPWKVYDGAGVLVSENYDFKGNLVLSSRQLLPDYKARVNWRQNPQLENEIFTSGTTFDALNRTIQTVVSHRVGTKLTVNQPVYNEANLLEREDVWLELTEEPEGLLNPETATQHAVKNINYNAKGQRELIEYGNGVRTSYEYDPLTFRLIHLQTLRSVDKLQDLFYTYDPVGNIITIRDDAQQTIYFNGEVVRPDAQYTYDATYRLIEARGREHIGQASQPQTTWNDEFRVKLAHPNDGQAMRNYFEFYEYDEVGNIMFFNHKDHDVNWNRAYEYNEASLIEPGKKSNRLSRTVVHPNGQQPIAEPYTYDSHGNMTSMPHLKNMEWDFEDQMHHVEKGNEQVYYVYDAAGERVRKVVKKNNGTLVEERIYLGELEIFRRRNGNGLMLERETLHIMDDKQRIAIVETRTIDTQNNDKAPRQLFRYQFGNHLGSAALELDEAAQVISYEEYYPYGSTSYQAVRSKTETPKRYRYTGKERDEESGLNYHGARYYAPWLGRWVSCDPIGLDDGSNLYQYVMGNPLVFVDKNGTQTERQLWLAEQKAFEIKPVATRTSRGITPLQRQALRGIDYGFGPGTGMDWSHPEGQTHGTTMTGQNPPLRPEPSGPNRERQHRDKLKKREAAAQGKPTRDAKGYDPAVKPGAPKIKQPAPTQMERHWADYAKNIKSPSPSVTIPAAAPPPTRAVRPSTSTLPEQLSFPFDKKPNVPKGKGISNVSEGIQKTGKMVKGIGKAAPFAGNVVQLYSIYEALEQGDYVGASLDVIGLIPIVGDLVDAFRLAPVLGEASGSLVYDVFNPSKGNLDRFEGQWVRIKEGDIGGTLEIIYENENRKRVMSRERLCNVYKMCNY